ncbi:MAG: hypothetical protein IJJ28_01830, partial [Lentisphaeria bacterium]|nr:hypothetical protein [Lentisphaeria bacterium]
MGNRFKHLLKAASPAAIPERHAIATAPTRRCEVEAAPSALCAPTVTRSGLTVGGVARDTACRMREPVKLYRPAEDFPAEERALRDEKLAFVRAVYELSRTARSAESEA